MGWREDIVAVEEKWNAPAVTPPNEVPPGSFISVLTTQPTPLHPDPVYPATLHPALKIQRMLAPLYVPSVWETQLFGAVEENRRALTNTLNPVDDPYPEAEFRLPEFSTWAEGTVGHYPNPDDIGLSLMGLGRINPLYQTEMAIRGPETNENQFYTSGRAILIDPEEVERIAQGIEWVRQLYPENFLYQTGLTAAQFGIGFASEQNVTEIIHDPFNVLEAFSVGTKLVNAISKQVENLRIASPLFNRAARGSETVVEKVFDLSWRNVRTEAQPFMGDAATTAADFGVDMSRRQRELRETVGGAWKSDEFFGREVAPKITEMIQTTPEAVRQDIRVTEGIFGVEEAVEDSVAIVSRVFPEIPEAAKYQIADFLNFAWREAELNPDIERFMGVNTADLIGNQGYILQSITPAAKKAAYKSIPDWFQKLDYKWDDTIGELLTATMHRREWRETIKTANDLAKEGYFGFAKGKPVWLAPGAVNFNRWGRRLLKRGESLITSAVRQSQSVTRMIEREAASLPRLNYNYRRAQAMAAELFQYGGDAPSSNVGAAGVGYYPYVNAPEGWMDLPPERISGYAAEPSDLNYAGWSLKEGDSRVRKLKTGNPTRRESRYSYEVPNDYRNSGKGAAPYEEYGEFIDPANFSQSLIMKIYKLGQDSAAFWKRANIAGRFESIAGETIDPKAFINYRIGNDLRKISYELSSMNAVEGLELLEFYKRSFMNLDRDSWNFAEAATAGLRGIELDETQVPMKLIGLLQDEINTMRRTIDKAKGSLSSGEFAKAIKANTLNPADARKLLDDLGLSANSLPEVPDGFVEVNKLFIDNPYELLFLRKKMGTQAISAAQMLRHLSHNPKFVKDPLAHAPTLGEMLGEAGFSRTFGRLSEDLQDIARNTKWKDNETAQGVLEFFRVSQDMDVDAAGLGRIFDNVLTMWRGATLTPFISYHSRNVVGGLLNGFMSGRMDIFDVIDAMHPTKAATAKEWELYRRAGLNMQTQMSIDFARIDAHLFDKPLQGTPLQNYWYKAQQYNPFGQGGRTVGQALEAHQQFALWLGDRRRLLKEAGTETVGGHTIKRGIADTAGADAVRYYMFDYGDVPRWFAHGSVARRLAAFPIWTLKNIPVQLKHLIETPTWFSRQGILMNSIIRASGREDEPIPGYLEDMGGFPIPGGGIFAPRNFLPGAGLVEIEQIVEPLLRGDIEESGTEIWRFVSQLLNPFVTVLPEQFMGSVSVGGGGRPYADVPTGSIFAPEANRTGWDAFTHKPIVSEFRQWNPLFENIGLDRVMPEWAQRTDNAARAFLRAYGEISGALREAQKAFEGQSDYTVGEYGTRRLGGVPIFKANPLQTVYFANRDVNREIAAAQERVDDTEATPEQLSELKNLYMRKLGYLGHATFLQVDPFSGEPRPWMDVQQEDDFTIQGRQEYYREYINTSYLALYGRTGMGNAYLHQPLDLTPEEREFVGLMMDSAIKAYIVAAIAGATEEGANVEQDIDYAEQRMFAPQPAE